MIPQQISFVLRSLRCNGMIYYTPLRPFSSFLCLLVYSSCVPYLIPLMPPENH